MEVVLINNLKKLRSSRKLSGLDLAEVLNISNPQYYGLESGRKTLNEEYLVKLADFYGVTIDYILGRTVSEEINPETANKFLDIKKADPQLLAEIAKAKDLPAEDRKKIKEYASMLIEKHTRELKK